MVLLLIFSISEVKATAPAKGVGIEPIKIKVKDNKVFYFSVFNDTDNEYIVTSKVVRDNINIDDKSGVPFTISPPIQLLNKRDDAKIKLIYLSGQKENKENKYYLIVSFVPKIQKDHAGFSTPIILSHKVPIFFE